MIQSITHMSHHVARLISLRDNPDTARAGMKWTEEEDVELMERAVSGMDIDDIAKTHKRTVTGVKSRIMSNALAIAGGNNMTLEDVSNHVHIPLEELQAHKQRSDDKKAQPKKSTTKNTEPYMEGDKYMKLLTEIRDLLKEIANK